MEYQEKIKEVKEEIRLLRNYLAELEEILLPKPNGPPVLNFCEKPPYIEFIEICDAFLNWARSRPTIGSPYKKPFSQ